MVEAAGFGQDWRGAPEVVVASATAWEQAARTDGNSLEVFAGTTDKIHKVHIHPWSLKYLIGLPK